MVVQDDNQISEVPDEMSIVKSKSIKADKKAAASICEENSPEESTNFSRSMKKKQKHKKNAMKRTNSSISTHSDELDPSHTEISTDDLLELRTVYNKCKSVIKKIEAKYGHLLDLDSSNGFTTDCSGTKRKKQVAETNGIDDSECQCTLNKKIVFDEEGKEVTTDAVLSNHICPKKLMLQKYENVAMNFENNLQIEYHSNDIELPNNLQELRLILQNPNIETTYRNQVIHKVKIIKQEHSNEIKFIKQSLIEKLKCNSDEIFSFNGANLCTLLGYPY